MRVRNLLPVLLPALIAVAVGLPGLQGGLIRDDILYITQNPHVTEPTSLATMFRTPFQPDHELGLFRPLTTATLRLDFVLSRALDFQVSRHGATLFHVTNLVLAAGAVVLLFGLARAIGFGPVAAGMGAALFAAHPARTEAVCWISGRAEGLMTLFSLASLLVAARAGGRWRGPVAALLAVLAFFSKEQAIVLLVLVPMLPDLHRRDRIARGAWLLAALLGAFAWRTHVVGAAGPTGGQQVLDGWSFIERVPLGLSLLGEYVRLILWPIPLLNEYDEPASVPLFAALIGTAFVGLFVWRCLRDRRDAFLLALFAGPLAIVLNVLYRTGETFAERFVALPMAGAMLFVVRACAVRPRLGGSILFTATCVCTVLAARRAYDWRSDEILTAAMIRDAPESAASWRLQAGVHRRDRTIALETLKLATQDLEGQENLRRLSSVREGERPLIDELLAQDHVGERQAAIAEEQAQRKKMYDAMRKGIALDDSDHYLKLDIAKELKAEATPKQRGGAIDLFALEEAERHLRDVISGWPASWEAQNLLAEVLLARASKLIGPKQEALIREAEALLRETLRLEPRRDVAGQDLARILLRDKRVPELLEFLETQETVFTELAERRWWDPRGLQLKASVLRSIAQLRGDAADGMIRGLPLLREALERSSSAPWRVRLIQTNLLPTLRELSRSSAANRQPWLRQAAELLAGEIERLTHKVDGPACLRSDLMAAIAALELERNDLIAAAHWFERAGEESPLPDVRENLLRSAGHLWLRKAVETAPGRRVGFLQNAVRLRRRVLALR